MKCDIREKRICPKCGKEYNEHPALSRDDNITMICSDCGVLESLQSIGIDEKEQAEILRIIHQHTRGVQNEFSQ